MASSSFLLPEFPNTPEFALVSRLLAGCSGTSLAKGELGPGDDAAFWRGLLYSKDLSVEGVHYRMDWSSPEQAVEKALRSNLSDINAMGGRPLAVLLGLCLSQNWNATMREIFVDAVAKSCSAHGLLVLGGDMVQGAQSSISITIIGEPGPRLLCRSHARPGHVVCVSAPLGASAAGLVALERGLQSQFPELVLAHRVPNPPLDLGPILAKNLGVGAVIDISDGLSSELHHIAKASGVGIHLQNVPLHPGVKELAAAAGLCPHSLGLHGGEDYQLLFTMEKAIPILDVADAQPISTIVIGKVVEGSGVLLQSADGSLAPLNPGSYTHFPIEDSSRS